MLIDRDNNVGIRCFRSVDLVPKFKRQMCGVYPHHSFTNSNKRQSLGRDWRSNAL